MHFSHLLLCHQSGRFLSGFPHHSAFVRSLSTPPPPIFDILRFRTKNYDLYKSRRPSLSNTLHIAQIRLTLQEGKRTLCKWRYSQDSYYCHRTQSSPKGNCYWRNLYACKSSFGLVSMPQYVRNDKKMNETYTQKFEQHFFSVLNLNNATFDCITHCLGNWIKLVQILFHGIYLRTWIKTKSRSFFHPERTKVLLTPDPRSLRMV